MGLIIDCFAGGGGASVGIEMALGRHVDIAINHDPAAILMHKTNHPDTLHLTEDIFKVDLQKYVKGQHVDLMWASPDCFPAGNLVFTDRGYKAIEEVECFDRVLTHTGEYRTVTRTIKKNDRKFANIRIAGAIEFQATLNHPFLARKKYTKSIHGSSRTTKTVLLEPQWINAENLTDEYRVAIPINAEAKIPSWGGCVMERHNQYGRTVSWIENEYGRLMGDSDFWWIVGRYFGDGSLSIAKGTVDICCAFCCQNEIRERLEKTGIKYTERDKKTTHSFMISSKELCVFLEQFGIGSLNKAITPVILDLPVPLLKSFAEGYLSADGHEETIEDNVRVSFCTVSEKLAYGMQHVLLKAYGRYASMRRSENRNNVIEGRTVNVHPVYNLLFYRNESNRLQYVIEDGVAWVNVKSVKIVNDVQKSVYTLSVDTDESFTINNIAVHNCTSHSKAKGGQPRNSGLRILPWAVYKHAKAILPDVIIMENVEEIQQWGPLDKDGRPIKERSGEDYKKFITAMISLGYEFESKELIAADYGAPTTRKRWYAIFRRDGRPISWPAQTHFKNGEPRWKPCGDYIDWSDLGKSIFDRKKPLAEATQKRIANGIKKYIIDNPDPYIVGDKRAIGYVIQYHGEQKEGYSRGQLLSEPIKTIDTSNRYGLVTAFISKFYKTGVGQVCDEPCHTITTSPGHFGIVSASLVKYYGNDKDGQPMDNPLGTIVTKDRFALVSAFLVSYYGRDDAIWPVDYPVGTVTTHDRFGLVGVSVDINGETYMISDIFLRMLKPGELKIMQGFPKDYIIDRDYRWRKYPSSEQVKRIGNSVVPTVAKAIVEANCGYLKVGERTPSPIIYYEGQQMAFC